MGETAACLGRGLAGQKVKDITEHFRRSPMRVSQAVLEFEDRLRKEESLGKIPNNLRKD